MPRFVSAFDTFELHPLSDALKQTGVLEIGSDGRDDGTEQNKTIPGGTRTRNPQIRSLMRIAPQGHFIDLRNFRLYTATLQF
jgi:hypothetical protein